MPRERASIVIFAALLPWAGCVRGSIRGDLDQVKARAHAQVLPKVATKQVDPTSDDDVRALLERPLDAEAAVRVALLNNRALRASLRELGVTRGQLMEAGLVANPILEVEALPERDSDLELRVEYEVTSLILAPLRARVAAAVLEAARFEAAGEVVRLGYEVRSGFYMLQSAEQRLAIAQRSLDALAAGRDAALALLEAGNVPKLEASQQIAAYERARIGVAQRELELAERRERMQRLLGLHGRETEWRVAGGLAAVPAELSLKDDLETRALEASLDLRALAQRVEAAARRLGLARTSGWLPETSVDFHALRTDPDSPESTRNYRYGGGVSVSVPLFDRHQGDQRAAQAQFEGLLERYQGLAIDLRSAVRDTRNRLVSAHARARQYERVIVPAQNTVMEHTLLQYNAMQLDVFRLLEARREQLEIELAFVETQREYWDAASALGALLEGKLILQRLGVPSGAAVGFENPPNFEVMEGGH